MKLYIIGNGFDLHHELDTSYFSFGDFLRRNNPDIYENLVDFLGFTDLPPSLSEVDKSKHSLWSDFENGLAGLDTESVLEEFSYLLPQVSSPDFRDRDWGSLSIEMERILENLTEGLLTQFKSFILQVNYPELNLKKRLRIDSDSIFISFNYTETLQKYYDIDDRQILYIHGKASSDEQLILGHGIDPINFEEKKAVPPENATDEELEEWRQCMADNYDHSYEMGKQTINNYFTCSFKNTEKVIADSATFFKNLSDVDEIIIIGHSLSSVDIPYFYHIHSIVSENTEWIATYYQETERETHHTTLCEIGIKSPKLISVSKLL
ncbi:bacteriophage abortive infection AbiH family protein [Salmonella enterica]|nr:bacteriophage abortive infection AbiH family protein [Salmonella enterica]